MRRGAEAGAPREVLDFTMMGSEYTDDTGLLFCDREPAVKMVPLVNEHFEGESACAVLCYTPIHVHPPILLRQCQPQWHRTVMLFQ